jgi:hypothetical protein
MLALLRSKGMIKLFVRSAIDGNPKLSAVDASEAFAMPWPARVTKSISSDVGQTSRSQGPKSCPCQRAGSRDNPTAKLIFRDGGSPTWITDRQYCTAPRSTRLIQSARLPRERAFIDLRKFKVITAYLLDEFVHVLDVHDRH